MSDPRYEQVGTPETKVLEECAEVIQAVCKAQRFGWFNWHPNDPTKRTNLDRVKAEMTDAVEAFERLEAYMRDLSHDYYGEAVKLARMAPHVPTTEKETL